MYCMDHVLHLRSVWSLASVQIFVNMRPNMSAYGVNGGFSYKCWSIRLSHMHSAGLLTTWMFGLWLAYSFLSICAQTCQHMASIKDSVQSLLHSSHPYAFCRTIDNVNVFYGPFTTSVVSLVFGYRPFFCQYIAQTCQHMASMKDSIQLLLHSSDPYAFCRPIDMNVLYGPCTTSVVSVVIT